MSPEATKAPRWFKDWMAFEVKRYPGFKPEHDIAEVYWGELKRFHPLAIKEGFEAARGASPEFFPSAPKVLSQCIHAANKRARERAEAEANSYSNTPADPRVPKTSKGQRAYIAEVAEMESTRSDLPMTEARRDFETLARMWECQSALNIPLENPGAQLLKLWDKRWVGSVA